MNKAVEEFIRKGYMPAMGGLRVINADGTVDELTNLYNSGYTMEEKAFGDVFSRYLKDVCHGDVNRMAQLLVSVPDEFNLTEAAEWLEKIMDVEMKVEKMKQERTNGVDWRPVSGVDDLPEQGTAVLVCGWAYEINGERPKQVSIGWVNKDEDPWEPIVSEEIEKIVYWMPMPGMPNF